ncbi:GNAT family N-acetyltransferase [Pseudomonas chlororaphis]|uniref:GNAT family N-acetyltransferase n=1 Tax=Pseudomonas chlororaphis TaxID=587753 RepID=UPI00046F8BEC|nr:GNAT family N-acetyltransferase [Pseudomonas chlororaphis]AZC52595.1 Acetyltransferase, GNAT family [Pseudomonas chlororaphis subsp. piscium]AZC58970.1 Acetyltransferase, GNAT family [Pseudomonas chlororaphis subsp. piscium]AZC65178.1 Acetyltransferase, GNAT family [Pseudomonas chlororaphis subsp. piscium]AZC71418.1 Acetyltransferase, GNAT family [Pseudomonas chlororaphis subsp. piscium]AZC77643.1 Acetyltransferase, GNAT family [Pseudomonas chlororaphis subsp. piscium]
MPDTEYLLLADTLRPLLNKFYRAHNSPMRAAGEGQSWVAKRGAIIAGLSLTPVAQGHWLTGLFVDPAHRGQGIAARLVEQARGQLPSPVWLFCHPDLQALYERMGFATAPALPQALADRLARYRRSKSLIAMGIDPLVRSTSDNV